MIIGPMLHLLRSGIGPTQKYLMTLTKSGYWGIAAVINRGEFVSL